MNAKRIRAACRMLTAGGLAWAATPASAQTAPLPDVPSFCSASEAFGQTLGGKTIAGAQEPGLGISTFVSLPPRYAPFDGAEVIVSRFSKQVNRVNAIAIVVSEQEAARMVETIRAQFRRAGWIEAGGKGFAKQAYDPLGDDIADFNSEPGGLANPPTGRRVEVDSFGKKVNVTCIDLPGFVKHVAEALGPPPVGSEKPTPPFSPGTVPVTLDCTKPASETDLQLMHDDQKLQEWMGRYKAINDYFEALMEWDGQQFVRGGKWTDKQKKDFELGLLSRPELTESWSYFLGLAMRTLNRLAAVMSSADSNDGRACQALNGMFADMSEAGKRTLSHAEAIDRIYQAEATKLGIKLN
jgi:hypothetical protein